MLQIEEYQVGYLVKAYRHARQNYKHLHDVLLKLGAIAGDLKLPDVRQVPSMRPSIVLKYVEEEFGVSPKENGRTHRIMRSRHAAAYLLKTYTLLSSVEIATHCNQTDHTSALNSIRKCSEWMDVHDDYRSQIKNIEFKIAEFMKQRKSQGRPGYGDKVE